MAVWIKHKDDPIMFDLEHEKTPAGVPITNVSTLLDVCEAPARHARLGLPNKFGQLSLYDGTEKIPVDETIKDLVKRNRGRSAKDPLVLVCKSKRLKAFETVDQVADRFFASENFNTIKSSSEENLAETTSSSSESHLTKKPDSSVIENELKNIESSPLFDDRLEDTLKRFGLQLPYAKLSPNSFHNRAITVMVGVSGCGKSRTCMDIAKNHQSLYFEVSMHEDIRKIIGILDRKSLDDSFSKQEIFDLTSQYLSALFLARILLLEKLGLGLGFKKLLSYQKSKSFQISSESLTFELIRNCDNEQVECLLSERMSKYIVIIDEAQDLLDKLLNSFKNSQNKMIRPLFHYMVDFVSSDAKASFWCGTHLRLRDIDRFSSAAAGKPSEIITFRDFQSYSFDDIKKLLEIFFGADRYYELFTEQPADILEVCYMLQGRPRIITNFFESLKYKSNESFKSVFDSYVIFMTQMTRRKQSFRDFWARVVDHPVKMNDIETGEEQETPDHYLFMLLTKYLFREPDITKWELKLSGKEIDLIGTGLVSLTRIDDEGASYAIVEPLVFEAAIVEMRGNHKMSSKFMKKCANLIVSHTETSELDASSRGKMIDKYVALRFRLGWWNQIPNGDAAWNEIPEPFREKFHNLAVPKYVALERSVNDHMLLHTFSNDSSPIYVLPAEKSGPDGFYRFIAYFGKSSFKLANQSGDIYVDSSARGDNMVYTDVNKWFKSLNDCDERRDVMEVSRTQPLLFICGEWPFYGPVHATPPEPCCINDNWVIHLDLRSRLAYYLLGKEFVEGYARLVSPGQRSLMPLLSSQ